MLGPKPSALHHEARWSCCYFCRSMCRCCLLSLLVLQSALDPCQNSDWAFIRCHSLSANKLRVRPSAHFVLGSVGAARLASGGWGCQTALLGYYSLPLQGSVEMSSTSIVPVIYKDRWSGTLTSSNHIWGPRTPYGLLSCRLAVFNLVRILGSMV